MKLKRLWINGFKNLNNFELDFSDKEGITVLIGNNGSGKSNVLEAISAIFTGLFKMSTPQRKPDFEYEIEYELNENEHYYLSLKEEDNELKYEFKKDGNRILVKDMKSSPSTYLPSKIILSYSGEENRIWELYYKHLHSDFMQEIKKSTSRSLPVERLFDVDGAYWNEALIVFIYSELENNKKFLENNLKINNIESIEIEFDIKTYNKFPSNSITDFIKAINPNLLDRITFTKNNLREMDIGYENELFVKLVASTTSNLITNLEINFDSGLKTEDLSEGQKKQILIRAILEFITDENSLVLFDEPDSHIHVANKGDIKFLLEEYPNRETILTTHSPSLMHKFQNHLVYLENGEVKGHEKADILREISGDSMSFAEQQIVLNTNSHILMCEGVNDLNYIKKALEVLNRIQNNKYKKLEDIVRINCGGADNVPYVFEEIIKDSLLDSQICVTLFDYDKTGETNKIKIDKIIEEENLINVKTSYHPHTDTGVDQNINPTKDTLFLMENYFSVDSYKSIILDNFNNKNDFKSLSEFQNPKSIINKKYKTFDDIHFNDFSILFDKLLNLFDLEV